MNRRGKFKIELIVLFLILNLAHENLLSQNSQWVDSLMQRMTIEEKIGQLFMIKAYSKNDKKEINQVKRYIDKYHIGGVAFFQGSPRNQAKLVEEYQKKSKIPLLVGMDAEWGLGMRFPKDAISFPRQMTLGAIEDESIIYKMGQEIGRQLKLVGANVNFAPVVDVNSNPNNPVINTRSFGENPQNVLSKSKRYIEGMQAVGVQACIKHFPGHGDTDTDSHHNIPIINHDRTYLDSVELYPFRNLLQTGEISLMAGHLEVPALEQQTNRPASTSTAILTDLLRGEYKYSGLIYTDALDMAGITKQFKNGQASVEAFTAGSDILLMPSDVPAAFAAVQKAVKTGRISEQRLNQSVWRILTQKEKLDLNLQTKFTNTSNLRSELKSTYSKILVSEIYEEALTLVSNESNILPFTDIEQKKVGAISLGVKGSSIFQNRIRSYVDVQAYNIPPNATPEMYKTSMAKVVENDIVFVGLHSLNATAKSNFGISEEQIEFINSLSAQTDIILTVFGSPYTLQFFEGIPTCLIAYQDREAAQEAAAQALFGVTTISGKLPVSGSPKFQSGHGIKIEAQGRLGFSTPERVGMSSDSLRKIKKLMDKMIGEKAAPGCQILVAKDNRIVYWQSFGYHTYNKKQKSKLSDIYDVASVTKIMAGTVSMMHLQDQGQFDVTHQIKQYIPEEDTTTKADLIYEDIMAHHAGLAGWIPFYRNTMTDGRRPKQSPKYYRSEQSDSFNIEIQPKLFMRFDYQDTIWRRIFSSQLKETENYKYSDLAFYVVNKTIENLSGMQVDKYAHQHFYKPLGLRRTLFNPLNRFNKSQIPPTERDDYFRMTTVHGRVHDMGAAMLDGISGHAGLFSNGYDLAVMMQMLLNKGYYAGKQYIKPAIVDQYTTRHWRSSRRGLGFDMKELNPKKSLNMSEKASRSTFGHLGFTGTAVFADPEENLIYILLSNRTYPTMENNRFGRQNYRPKVQSIVYDAIMH